MTQPAPAYLRGFRTGLISAGMALAACFAHADPGTEADRTALFDDTVTKIMAREAFSPIKNERYGVVFPEAFEAHRADIIGADSDKALYWALVRLSNARHDRHLSVSATPGGLAVPETYNRFDAADYPGVEIDRTAAPVAPIGFLPDFSSDPVRYFVSDLAIDLSMVEGGERLETGDSVVAVNGMPFEDYLAMITPYYRFSTPENFWLRSAMEMNAKSTVLPENLYEDDLSLTLRKDAGETYTVVAPYLPQETVEFRGTSDPVYPGFEKVIDAESFDTYRARDGRNLLLIDMYGFREDLVSATDDLMAYAVREDLTSADIIMDTTRSRGGGRGAYLVQRLTASPFRTTFGNIRLSDVTGRFIDERVEQFESGEEFNDGAPETVGDPRWLIDWLSGDVTQGIKAGQAYSNDVPFKLSHAPEYSDGILYPAETHFTGDLVVWSSPYGGSHLDQFMSIIKDNDLGTILGMAPGGYSNTWEWEEPLVFPASGKPVVSFMWSIGHTIRPNGEVLEGNPAEPDDYIPLTADNHDTYYDTLMQKSLDLLSDTEVTSPDTAGQ